MRISDWSSDVCSSDLGYCQLLRLPALAVGVARGDSLVFFKGVGTMGSPKDEPITADHAFPVAEVAETFTAIVLKQMEKEGKLSLEDHLRSEEHTSELQSLMRNPYAVFCLTKKKTHRQNTYII